MGTYAVTGAASGIGQAVVKQLKESGHEVITVDIHNADINADLSDSDQVQSVIKSIQERAPSGLDGLVPCAGLGPDFGDKPKITLVNFFAVVDMVRGLFPALSKKKGAVVLISSNSSQMMEYNQDYVESLLTENREKAVEISGTVDGQTLYGGGKHAITRWMRRVNPEYAAAGVNLNAVAPGFTETAMTRAGLEDPEYGPAMRDFVDSIPIGRPGLAEDQANAISFLLSDKASFISGSVLFIDGGHDAVFRPDSF